MPPPACPPTFAPLQLRYWKVEAVRGYTPAGQPVLGAEEGTAVSSEDSARKVGRFVFRNRIQAFLKLRRRLLQDAEAEAAALQAAAAERAAAEQAAQRAARAAAAGAPCSPSAGHSNGFADVADRLGLAELFGGPADEPGEPAPELDRPALSAGAAGHPTPAFSGGRGAAAAAAAPDARRSLLSAADGSGGAAPGGVDGRRGSLVAEPGQQRRRGFGKEDLRLFLEARDAGGRPGGGAGRECRAGAASARRAAAASARQPMRRPADLACALLICSRRDRLCLPGAGPRF